MPWAAHNTISTSPIEGGIEISEMQYLEALKGMTEGLLVSIEDGTLALVEPPKEEPELPNEPLPTEEGEAEAT